MLRFAILASLLVAANADCLSNNMNTGCPCHSTKNEGPYENMGSCTCDDGWIAYSSPGWGCYKNETITCPPHSSPRDTAQISITNHDQCKCDEGYAMFGGSCVYAYIFHIHGRAWIQPFTAENFKMPQYNAFRQAMEGTTNAAGSKVAKRFVLPYSVHDAVNVENEIKSASMGVDKIVLAHTPMGENETMFNPQENTVSVGFALYMQSNLQSAPEDIVDDFKDATFVDEFEDRLQDARIIEEDGSVTESPFGTDLTVSVYIWALTMEFYHPAPYLEEGEVCTESWQCKCAEWENDVVDGTCTTQLACTTQQMTNGQFDDHSGYVVKEETCQRPYRWAPLSATAYPTPAPVLMPPPDFESGENQVTNVSTATFDFTLVIKCDCRGVTGDFSDEMTPAGVADCLATNGNMDAEDFGAISAKTMGNLGPVIIGVSKAIDEAGIPMQPEFVDEITYHPFAQPEHTWWQYFSPLWDTENGEQSWEATFDQPFWAYLNITQQEFVNSGGLGDYLVCPPSTGLQQGTADQILDEDGSHTNLRSNFQVGGESVLSKPANLPASLDNEINGVGVRLRLSLYPHMGNDNVFTEALQLYQMLKNDTTTEYATFKTELARQMSDNGFPVAPVCLSIEHKTLDFTPTVNAPTPPPAPTPTHRAAIPGSLPQCADGVNMEINGQMSYVFKPHSGYTSNETFMDTAETCMANIINEERLANSNNDDVSNVTYCHITPTTFELTSACEGCTGTKVTFDMRVAVPGQNMHDGNRVFDLMNTQKQRFLSDLNSCVGGQDMSDTSDISDSLIPDRASFIDVSVSSIELTYIEAHVTAEPTPSPSPQSIDCETTEWSDFTVCTKSCGEGGSKKRFRLITQNPVGDGIACPELTSTEECNAVACPIDCEMNDWEAWNTTCSKSCGGGEMTRSRTVKVQPENGGQECPASEYSWACNERPCPTDCELSDWTDWSECSQPCGGGSMWHSRTVIQAPYWDGESCGSLYENATCNENPCPTDCETSEWSDWGSCDKDCGGEAPGTRLYGAKQERTRYIVTPAQWGGLPCPTLSQTKLCALHPCGSSVCTVNEEYAATFSALSNDEQNEMHPNGLFPLTCTYENGIVYTHHVNNVHDNQMFMCYHNIVTEVCTCLCWDTPGEDDPEKDGYAPNNSYDNQMQAPAQSDISTFAKWQADTVQGENPEGGVRVSTAGGAIESGVFTSGGDGTTHSELPGTEDHASDATDFGEHGQQSFNGQTKTYSKTADADYEKYKENSAWYNKWQENGPLNILTAPGAGGSD